MKTKPWSIRILAFMFLIGPVINALVGSWILHVGFSRYVSTFFQVSHAWDLFQGLAIYPLAGLAIYAVKPWSYPVYLCVTAISTYSNLSAGYRHPHVFTLPIVLLLTALDMGLVTYFLIPAVRATYFNRALRWWESKPRYIVDTPAILDCGQVHTKCRILNISEGGAFIRSSKKLDLNSTTEITFSILGINLGVTGKVVYRRWKGLRGYGVAFVHTAESHHTMTRITKGFRQLGVRETLEHPGLQDSLKEWLVTLTRTGKGLFPEVPTQRSRKPRKAA